VTAILELERFSTGYIGNPAVRDLDLSVDAGEVVSLLGANGAGKTTTLLGVAGELKVLAGTVRLFGSMTKSPLHERARSGLAFVTEERCIFSRMTVLDNLRVGRCDLRRAFDIFPELEPLRDRPGGLLSGGEQQMLALGRALARRPRLLLVDELSLGLAPLVVTRLLQAVRTAADEDGIGALVVEQHIHRMMKSADRLYVLQRGRIAVSGTPSDLATRLDEVTGAYLALNTGPTSSATGTASVAATHKRTGAAPDQTRGAK
jgi:branched-chain amino acid transport system ATP-binding protein